MNSNRKSTMSREVFFLLWVILTGATMLVGQPILEFLIVQMDLPVTLSIGFLSVGLPLLIALVQWPLLIHHHRSMLWWAPATLIGSLLKILLGSSLYFILTLIQIIESSLFNEIGMVIFFFLSQSGLEIGIAQWLVLHKDIHKAGLWIPTVTIAWSLGNGMNYLSLLPWLMEPNILYWIIFHTFPVVITGLVMTYLIYGRRNNTSPDKAITAVC